LTQLFLIQFVDLVEVRIARGILVRPKREGIADQAENIPVVFAWDRVCKRRSNSGTGVGFIPVRFGVSLIRE